MSVRATGLVWLWRQPTWVWCTCPMCHFRFYRLVALLGFGEQGCLECQLALLAAVENAV